MFKFIKQLALFLIGLSIVCTVFGFKTSDPEKIVKDKFVLTKETMCSYIDVAIIRYSTENLIVLAPMLVSSNLKCLTLNCSDSSPPSFDRSKLYLKIT